MAYLDKCKHLGPLGFHCIMFRDHKDSQGVYEELHSSWGIDQVKHWWDDEGRRWYPK